MSKTLERRKIKMKPNNINGNNKNPISSGHHQKEEINT
jgi:hypothetical protein